jgi:hypothetical protein
MGAACTTKEKIVKHRPQGQFGAGTTFGVTDFLI